LQQAGVLVATQFSLELRSILRVFSNDVASERTLSPLAKGEGRGGMREPWKSKTVLLASREGCERTERERAWEDLVTGHAGTTPPTPPSQGGKRAQRTRDESAACARLTFRQPTRTPRSLR
jgi:hypothetical protein